MRSTENTEHLEWLQCHVQIVGIEENLVFNSQTNFMGQRKLLHHGKLTKVGGACGQIKEWVELVGVDLNGFSFGKAVCVQFSSTSSPSLPPLLPPNCPHPQIRGNKPLLGFLFNDFLLLAKPSGFFEQNMEPFKSGHFLLYRRVSVY